MYRIVLGENMGRLILQTCRKGLFSDLASKRCVGKNP